jgi:type II secretory pathway pseudopilin PulG
MNKVLIKKQDGMTLIELSIYITLVAAVLVMATSFAWNIINSRTKAFAVQEVEQNGRYIIEKFSQTVRQANDLTTPAISASGTTLTLAMKGSTVSTVVLNVNGTQLLYKEGSGPSIALNSSAVKVTSLNFTNISSANGKTKHVRLQFTLETINPSGRNEWEFKNDFETSVELLDR